MKVADLDSRAAAAIFGMKGEKSMAYIDRRAGLPKGTCARYQEKPQGIPLVRFAAICEAAGLSDQEILRVVKTYYRKGLGA